MSDSDTATTHVIAPEDIVWHKTDLGPKFWLSDNLVGSDYTSVFSAQLTEFGPGGGSSPHSHTYNHAFLLPERNVHGADRRADLGGPR